MDIFTLLNKTITRVEFKKHAVRQSKESALLELCITPSPQLYLWFNQHNRFIYINDIYLQTIASIDVIFQATYSSYNRDIFSHFLYVFKFIYQ